MTDIANIGTTANQTQLVIQIVHDEDGGATVHGMINQQPIDVIIVYANSNNLCNDQIIAQTMITLTNCNPDTIDLRHIGRHHETD